MTVQAELINGLCLGIEHCSGDEEMGFSYLIAINLFVVRFVLVKYS